MANEFIARKGLIALEDSQITGSLNISGTLKIPGVSDVSASLAAAVAGGDNLGNHTATQNLNMGGNAITNVGNVDGRDVSADGTKLDSIETNADVTDTSNVTSAGALMDSELAEIATVKALTAARISGSFTAASASFSTRVTANDAKVSYTDAAVTSVINTAGVISGSAQFGSSDNVTFGTIEATSLNVTSITSSIVTSSIVQTEGSNIFGDANTDTQTFNGHITASGNISASGTIIGSNLSGTNTGDQDLSSYIQASQTSSFIVASQTSSFSTATGVEDNADVTDTANVTSAGALMDSELAEIATVKSLTAAGISGSFNAASASFSTRVTANDAKTGYTDAAVKTKLDAENVISGSAANVRSLLNIEDGADVTDTSNVTSAGALMDSELAEIATVKALTAAGISGSFNAASASFSTRVTANDAKLTANTSNVTSAGALMDSELAEIATVKALTKAGISGSFTAASSSFSTRVTANDAKLTANTSNVTSAGALMDSELSDLAAVKAINQGLTTTSNVTFNNVDVDGTLTIPGFSNVSASLASAVAGGDNLGNHTATTDLNLNSNSIKNIVNITASGDISASGNLKIGNNISLSGVESVVNNSGTLVFGNLANVVQVRSSDPVSIQRITVTNITASSDISASGDITASAFKGDGSNLTNLPSQTDQNFTNADHSKLDGIEASADVTDATNVQAAGALMDSELAEIATVKALTAARISGSFTAASASFSTRVTANDAKTSYTDAAVKTKLNTENVVSGSKTNVLSFLNVEDGADVTDTSNVTSAGALMDSELAEIATVKALTKAGISGSFTAASASFSTRITANEAASASFSTRVTANDAKLTANTSNVTSAGALMDSELAEIATVKALTAAGISGSFNAASASFSTRVTANDAKLTANTSNVTSAGALMDSEVTNLSFVKGLTGGISDGNVLTANNAVADNDFLRIDGTEVEGLTAAEVRTALNVENGADVTDTSNVTSAGALMDSELAEIATVKALTAAGISGSFNSVSASLASDIPTNNNQLTNGAGYTTNTGTVDTTGTPADNQIAVFTDSNTIEGTSKLTFSDSDLLIHSTNADNSGIEIFGGVVGSSATYISPVGSQTIIKFGDGTSGHTFDFQNNKIAFDSDSTNTYIQADTSNPENIEIHADGNIELRADDNLEIHGPISTNITASSDISASGAITASGFKGDGSGLTNVSATLPSGVVSGSAQIADVTLTTAAQTNITSLGTLTTLTVDDITINGSTISDGADLTIDAEGDITLDANGADVILKDNGTEFGRFKRDSSDFVIKSATNNKDIVFRGVDNSTTITALTLDMSDAGKAIFTGNISSSGDIIGNEITSSKLLITKTGAASNETLISLVGSAGVEEFSVDEDGDLTCNDINVVNRDIKGNGTTRLTLGSTNLFVGDVRVNNTLANLNLRCSDSSIVEGQTMGKISLATNDGDVTDSADIKFIATEDHSNDPNSGTKIEFRADKNAGEGDETDTLMLTLNPNTGSIIESVHQNIYDTGSTALAANSAFGDIVKFGGSSTVAGGIYYLNSQGGWSLAQANASGTATSSLAVAVGTNSTTDGMCLRGFVNPFTDPGASIGNPVYLSDTSQGRFQATAPDSTGDIVRIIGYQYGTDLIYFNPSNDFIIHA